MTIIAQRCPPLWRATVVVAALMGCAIAGCRTNPQPIFSASASGPSWPAAPDAPRVTYIGELSGEASLRASPRGLEAIGSILTGPRPKARFVTPMAVAASAARIVVADPAAESPLVHILDLDQRSYLSIREAAGAPLRRPVDVAICGDRIAIADAERGAAFFVDFAGRFLAACQGALKRPAAVAWDAGRSELYVLDAGTSTIHVFNGSGAAARRFGGAGRQPGNFATPAGLAVAAAGGATRAAVADTLNFRAQLVSDRGEPLLQFGQKGDAAGNFALPRDIALDADGNIYVLDSHFENVQVFNPQGQLLFAFGHEGRGAGEFWLPSGISIDDENRLWIADTYNRRVQAFRIRAEEIAQ